MESKRKQTNRKQSCSQSFSLQCISSLDYLYQWRKSILVAYWSKCVLMKKKFSFYAKTQRQIKAEDQMISHLFSSRKHVYLLHILYHEFSKNPSNGYVSSSLEDSHCCAPLQKRGQVASVKLPTSFSLGYCRKVFRSYYIQTNLRPLLSPLQ